jgi:hypothetical protein
MGRRRRHDRHLPQRVYLHHGAYWFRPKDGKAVNLGPDLAHAITRYASLIGTAWSGRTLGDVIDRYRTQVLPTKRSAQTRTDEGKALDRLKRVFGHMLPDAVAAPMLYRYLDERRTPEGKAAPVAARHEIALLGHVYAKAIRWGVASRNPVRGIDYGERAGKRRKVELEEVNQLRGIDR